MKSTSITSKKEKHTGWAPSHTLVFLRVHLEKTSSHTHTHKNSSNTCISLRCSELRGINTTMWSAWQTEWIPKVCSHRAAHPLHPQHLLQSLCVCVCAVEAGIQSAAAAAQSACDSEAGLWSCVLHRAPLLCLPPNGGQRTIIGWRTSLQTVKGVTVIP